MDQFEKFRDKILICVDCKEEFAFTIGAQEYFAERGFTEDPKRCRNCYATVHIRLKRGTKAGDGRSTVSPPKPSGSPSHHDQD